MTKRGCKKEGWVHSVDDYHDLGTSASAKEIIDNGAIVERWWSIMSLDGKKYRIKQHNPNIPHVEFFDSLSDDKLNVVMSVIEHHTGADGDAGGVEGVLERTVFYLFSERKYLNYFKEVMNKTVEGHFPIEINLKFEGGETYTILPNESDRYIAYIDYNGVPVTIVVSPLDTGKRKGIVIVGDMIDEWTMEDNEYMGSSITE